MKRSRFLLAMLVLALAWRTTLAAEEEGAAGPLTGAVGFAGMYDSNLDRAWNMPGNDDAEGDFIYQLDAKLGWTLAWGGHWRMALDLHSLADWPLQDTDDSWFIENGEFYLGSSFGANTVSMLNNLRYFTTPDNEMLDLVRNAVTVTGKRAFSQRWTGLVGYENFLNHHPENSPFDYVMNGGLFEIRNTWTPLAYTYYAFDCLYYMGSRLSPNPLLPRPPADGYRYSGEIGFDVLFALRHDLQGSYSYQMDRGSYLKGKAPASAGPLPPPPGGQQGEQKPPPMPLEQVGGFEGEQTSLEVDDEFNYAKHKASLLYSLRLDDRFSISLFNEYIYKDFLVTANAPVSFRDDRTDRLFLTSVWITARIQDRLFAKAYDVYRMNWPTNDSEIVEEHIVSVGLESRF